MQVYLNTQTSFSTGEVRCCALTTRRAARGPLDTRTHAQTHTRRAQLCKLQPLDRDTTIDISPNKVEKVKKMYLIL